MSRHPGEILLHGYMTPLDVSAARLAEGIGVHRSTVSRLLGGQLRMTPAMAARLGKFFGVPARWWLLMQAEYDAEIATGEPTDGVDALPTHPDYLLTPQGAVGVEPEESGAAAHSSLGVQLVEHENGMIALLGGPS